MISHDQNRDFPVITGFKGNSSGSPMENFTDFKITDIFLGQNAF